MSRSSTQSTSSARDMQSLKLDGHLRRMGSQRWCKGLLGCQWHCCTSLQAPTHKSVLDCQQKCRPLLLST